MPTRSGPPPDHSSPSGAGSWGAGSPEPGSGMRHPGRELGSRILGSGVPGPGIGDAAHGARSSAAGSWRAGSPDPGSGMRHTVPGARQPDLGELGSRSPDRICGTRGRMKNKLLKCTKRCGKQPGENSRRQARAKTSGGRSWRTAPAERPRRKLLTTAIGETCPS